jgi:hypothetical protein
MFTSLKANEKPVSSLPLRRKDKEKLFLQRQMKRSGQSINIPEQKKNSKVVFLENQISYYEEKINFFQKKLQSAKLLHGQITSQTDKTQYSLVPPTNIISSTILLNDMKVEIEAKNKVLEEVKKEEIIYKISQNQGNDDVSTDDDDIRVEEAAAVEEAAPAVEEAAAVEEVAVEEVAVEEAAAAVEEVAVEEVAVEEVAPAVEEVAVEEAAVEEDGSLLVKKSKSSKSNKRGRKKKNT